MLVESLSSGSSGNALLIRSRRASLLIDCGLGPRMLRSQLDGRGLSARTLSAALLTHEHDDHVRGLDAIRSAQCDVIATTGTLSALGLPGKGAHALDPFSETDIGDLSVVALPTSHDALQPCGYSISDSTARVTVLTDLGAVDEHIPAWIAASDLVVIESNHDVHMLRSGPYPAHLKRRVQSRLGHLSNVDCAATLAAAFAGSARGRTVWLAHLSATNNRPDLAVRTVRSALIGAGGDAHVVVALPRRESGPVWDSDVARPSIPDQLSLFGA